MLLLMMHHVVMMVVLVVWRRVVLRWLLLLWWLWLRHHVVAVILVWVVIVHLHARIGLLISWHILTLITPGAHSTFFHIVYTHIHYIKHTIDVGATAA